MIYNIWTQEIIRLNGGSLLDIILLELLLALNGGELIREGAYWRGGLIREERLNTVFTVLK